MVLKLSTKVHFLEFGGDLSQKPKSIKAIYIYTSESSYYSLSENDMVYRGWSHRSWDINNLNIKKRCWISRNWAKFFDLKQQYHYLTCFKQH